MSEPTVNEQPKMFIRKERVHLDALEKRLAHLHDGQEHTERRGNPAYPPGEAVAIMWALDLIRGIEEPITVRVERLEQKVRRLSSQVGRIESDLMEED